MRAFVSSTFRAMAGERDALMTHVWPTLRRRCAERQVEFVEVDLRWGITEKQSTVMVAPTGSQRDHRRPRG